MKNPLSAEIVRTGNRRTIPGDVRRRKAASAQVYGEDGAQGKCEGQAAMKEEGSGQDKGRNDAQTSGNDMIRACGGDTRTSSESDRLRTLLHHNGKTLVERDAIPGFTIMPPPRAKPRGIHCPASSRRESSCSVSRLQCPLALRERLPRPNQTDSLFRFSECLACLSTDRCRRFIA